MQKEQKVQKVQRDEEKEKFLKVLQEIKKVFPSKMTQMKKDAQQERRTWFQKEPVKYRQVIQEYTTRQAYEMEKSLQDLLAEHGYDQSSFEQLVQSYMHDPEVVYAVQSLSQDTIFSNVSLPPNLDANMFEELLKYQAERFEQLADEECQGGETAIAYCNTLIYDEIQEKYGFNEDQISAAMLHYGNSNDQRFNKYIERIKQASFKFMRSRPMM